MEMKHNCSVVLADDHIVLRDALAKLINSFDNFRVTAVAADGQQVLEVLKNTPAVDILLLDLNMPRMDGFETAWQVNHLFPHIKIVTLTMFDSEIALIRLLQNGVRGFLKKDIHPDELKTALITVANEGYYYSPTATGKLAGIFQRSFSTQSPIEKAMLSENEITFLKYASTDLTYKEIAQKMHLTPRAIDGYRDGLFDKLDVKSRVGLAIYAVKNGIVQF